MDVSKVAVGEAAHAPVAAEHTRHTAINDSIAVLNT
jgi:hypothetical protein